MGDDAVKPPAERARESAQRARPTFRRAVGIDRSGPLPEATRSGAPLRPWTLPNLIVAVRLAGIPVFLVIVYSTDNGESVAAGLLYLGLALSDYADGITARLTGQYSRLGTIIDPLVDRLLVVAGLVPCWTFELLPRWAIAVLVARELFMLVLARYGMRKGVDITVNWPGRIGVFWTLAAPFWAFMGVEWAALTSLSIGLALTLTATALYVRQGLSQASTSA